LPIILNLTLGGEYFDPHIKSTQWCVVQYLPYGVHQPPRVLKSSDDNAVIESDCFQQGTTSQDVTTSSPHLATTLVYGSTSQGQ